MQIFQLRTHAHIYNDDVECAGSIPASTQYPSTTEEAKTSNLVSDPSIVTSVLAEDVGTNNPTTYRMPSVTAFVLLTVSTIFISLVVIQLVDSINGLTENSPITPTWVSE